VSRLIYSVMIQEGFPTQDVIFLDKSFTDENKANTYCEFRNSSLTADMLEIYECDYIHWFVQVSVLED